MKIRITGDFKELFWVLALVALFTLTVLLNSPAFGW